MEEEPRQAPAGPAAAGTWAVRLEAPAGGSGGKGKPLQEAAGDRPLAPASVAKLFTAAAALARLGAGWRFRTAVGEAEAGVLAVATSGDPSLTSADLAALVGRWKAAAAGADGADPPVVRRVELRLAWPPGSDVDPTWELEDLGRLYAAPAASCSVDGNVEALAEERALDPRDPRVRLHRPARRAVQHAAGHFLAKLRAAFKANGLRADFDVAVTCDGDRAPGVGGRAVEHASEPLAALLRRMLHASDNLVAECLFLTLGAGKGAGNVRGRARAAVREALAGLGVDEAALAQIHLQDGSGLSRRSFVTAHAVTALLRAKAADPAFVGALPRPGQGTLARRFGPKLAPKLAAKTGSMTGVSALAGYATLEGVGDCPFAVLCNCSLEPPRVLQAKVEYVVERLLRAREAPPAATGGAGAPVRPEAVRPSQGEFRFRGPGRPGPRWRRLAMVALAFFFLGRAEGRAEGRNKAGGGGGGDGGGGGGAPQALVSYFGRS